MYQNIVLLLFCIPEKVVKASCISIFKKIKTIPSVFILKKLWQKRKGRCGRKRKTKGNLRRKLLMLCWDIVHTVCQLGYHTDVCFDPFLAMVYPLFMLQGTKFLGASLPMAT